MENYRIENKDLIKEKDKERKKAIKDDPKKYKLYRKRYNKWYNNKLKADHIFVFNEKIIHFFFSPNFQLH